MDLLRRAQQSLPRHPAEALAAAEEHRRRFPGGTLAQEREVIAISALLALKRRTDAETAAARFAESYPRSVHRAGIEALLRGATGAGAGGAPRDGGRPGSSRLDQNGADERARTAE
jgi:hypothetical protein